METADIEKRRPGPVARLVYRGIGAAAVALAAVGVILPGVPTTPFLLLALWAFARGKPEWADRLRAHPRFGELIRKWESHRAIPWRAKIAAGVGMGASWAILAWRTERLWLEAAVGAVLVCVFAYVATRPSA